MRRTIQKRISRTFTDKSRKSQPSSSNAGSVHSMRPADGMISQASNASDDRASPAPAHVKIDETPSKQTLEDAHNHSRETYRTSPSPRPSDYREPHRDAQSLAARYERAFENVDGRSPSTGSLEAPQSRQQTVGVAADTSSSSDDGGFDWDDSDESELDEVEREERKQMKLRQQTDHHEHEHHIRRAKRLRKVYLSFMRLSRPIRMALLLVVGSGIAIAPALIMIFQFPGSSIRPHILVWSIWAAIGIAASCTTSIFVDFLPAVVIKSFYLLYGSTPEKLKTQVELWMSVRFWIKVALSFTCYWVTLLVMFSPEFPFHNDSRLSYFEWVKKVAGALFGASLVLLIEKILLQVIKLNFHKTSLKDRLEQNEKALWALDKLAAAKELSKPTRKLPTSVLGNFGHVRSGDITGRNTPARMGAQTPVFNGKPSRPKAATVVDLPMTPMAPHPATPGQGGGVSVVQLEQQLQLEVQKKNKRRSANLLDMTDQLTTAIANATLKDEYRRGDDRLGSTHSAKKLARKLFEGLDEDHGGVLTRDEFEPYFKNRADAAEAFKLFDKDGNGDIDRKEMRNAVSRIYRERRALATSLKDMSSAVAKLDAVLLAIALVITIFIWLFIFNPKGTTAQLVPMATIILGFSFVFGNAAKNLFESMLFIFSIHPYDVGDLVFIDESPMFVLEFGLFSTTFQRVDGQVIVAPNSVLGSQKYILNVRRSGSMWETTNVMVSFDTPLEVLHEFRARLRQYVADNSREWKGGLDVNIDFMQNQNLIQLIVAMEHKSNWQDWGARWDRRTFLMKEMKKIMDSLNIIYKLPPQPVSFLPGRVGPRPGCGRPRDGSNPIGSPMRGPGLSSPGTRPSTNFLGNAGKVGTNSQQPWNTGSLPALRVETGRF